MTAHKYDLTQVKVVWGTGRDAVEILPHDDSAVTWPPGGRRRMERVETIASLTSVGVTHCKHANVWPPAVGTEYKYGYLAGVVHEADAFEYDDGSGMLFVTIVAPAMSVVNQALAGVDTLAIDARRDA